MEALFSLRECDEEETEVGIESLIEVPLLPIVPFTAEQVTIITALSDTRTPFEVLIKVMSPSLEKGTPMYEKERSRLSHHLTNLEYLGLTLREKVGKEAFISLTPLGQIFKRALERKTGRTS